MTPGPDSSEAYLRTVLELDPQERAPTIIQEWRKRRTDSTSARKGGDRPEAGDRRVLTSKLGELRGAFWDRDPAENRRLLEELALDGHPDLARYRDRLLRVTDAQAASAAAEEDSRIDRRLLQELRAVAVAPEREAARLRQQFFVRAGGGGVIDRAILKSARRLESHHPRLHELEPAWLERIRRAKEIHKDSLPLKGGIGCLGFYAIYLLVKYLLRGLTWLMES